MPAKYLQAHRQFPSILPHGIEIPGTPASEPYRYIYRKIHLERVGRALPNLNGGTVKSRQDGIHLAKPMAEVLGYQGTDFLTLQVVGVVIARESTYVRARSSALPPAQILRLASFDTSPRRDRPATRKPYRTPSYRAS